MFISSYIRLPEGKWWKWWLLGWISQRRCMTYDCWWDIYTNINDLSNENLIDTNSSILIVDGISLRYDFWWDFTWFHQHCYADRKMGQGLVYFLVIEWDISLRSRGLDTNHGPWGDQGGHNREMDGNGISIAIHRPCSIHKIHKLWCMSLVPIMYNIFQNCNTT